MIKEKALKNQGLEFREDIIGLGGGYWNADRHDSWEANEDDT